MMNYYKLYENIKKEKKSWLLQVVCSLVELKFAQSKKKKVINAISS